MLLQRHNFSRFSSSQESHCGTYGYYYTSGKELRGKSRFRRQEGVTEEFFAFAWPPSGSRVPELHTDGRIGARQHGYALSVIWNINTNNTCSRWLGSLMEA